MRWLILPDIHDKLRRANQIIEREPHDHLLQMGDLPGSMGRPRRASWPLFSLALASRRRSG